MKPERIQFAPQINVWEPSSPFISKAFACDTQDDASHYQRHITRVARFFTDTSELKTSISEDFVVGVKIYPVQSETVTEAQYALGQRIDQALHFLEAPSVPDVDGPEIEN